MASRIRIIVVNQLPQTEHNAMLHLFSTSAPLLAYGVHHYRVHSDETSNLLLRLFIKYQEEEFMPDMLEEFTRESINRFLKELPLEKRLEGLSAEERVQGLSAEELVQGLSAETLRELADKLKDSDGSTKTS